MKKLVAASSAALVLFIALPALASTQTINRNLYYGLTHNTDVEALQQFLTTQGDYTGPISGNFFSLTAQAVKKFQQANGITPASGYVGSLTRAAINKILSEQGSAASHSSSQPTSTTTQPSTAAAPAINNSVLETSNSIPAPTARVSDNPAAQCLATKQSWDAFATAHNNMFRKLTALLNSYNDLAFGTANRPTGTTALFSYNYTRLTTGKDSFTSQINDVKKLIGTLPQPPRATSDDMQMMKDGYLNSLTYLQNSFDLAMQAFKIFGEDKDGYISSSELSESKALFDDSVDAYHKIDQSVAGSNSIISQFKADLQTGKVTGCVFTFYPSGLVESTIPDEKLFTQQFPKSSANADGTTLISVKTDLPIILNDGGQTETVLKLVCNGESRDVARMDPYTVGNVMSKSYTPVREQCNFVYSGNGNDLSTLTLDFNW